MQTRNVDAAGLNMWWAHYILRRAFRLFPRENPEGSQLSCKPMVEPASTDDTTTGRIDPEWDPAWGHTTIDPEW